MSTNAERAEFATDALEAFRRRVGDDEDETLIADLIGDLLHLVQSLGGDPPAAAAKALGMWHAESRAPDGEPAANDTAYISFETHPANGEKS